MATQLKLKNVRLSYPHIWQKQAYDANSVPKYSAALIVPKGSDADKEIRAAIKAECDAAFGAKSAANQELWRNNANKCSYIDGDLLGKNELAGAMRLTGKNDARPRIVDLDGRTPLTQDDGRPYGGCFVNAVVEIYAQKGENAGIRCSLMGLQFAKHGEAFGGGRAADDDAFDDVSDGAFADDWI